MSGKDASFEPSAPPLLARASTTDLRTPLVSPTESNSSALPAFEPEAPGSPSSRNVESDAALWRDLLGRARGNHNQAAQWMHQIGATVPLALQAARDVPGIRPEGPDSNDLDVQAAEAGAPATFFCPISFRCFRDPVLLPTGQTYERRYIERWLQQGNLRCPATGQRLARPVALTPNGTLRRAIEEWADKNAPWMLGSDGHLKPIPEEDDFATPRGGSAGGRSPPPTDPDLALAIRLQQEEMARMRSPPAQPLPHPPAYMNNPVGPPHPASLPQRARQYMQPTPAHKRRSLLPLLLLLTELAYIATYLTSMGLNDWTFESLKLNPMAGGSAATMRKLGAVEYDRVVNNHQWWRVLAAPFLCSGLIQLFCLTTCLWTFGRYLERVLHVPTLSVVAVYLVSGIMGGLASANLAVDRITVTSSAAVCGLLGGVWADQLLHWSRYKQQWLTFPLLILVTAVFGLLGLIPLMNNFAHIAGFVAGFLMCTVAVLNTRADGTVRRHVGCCLVIQLVATSLLIAMLAMGIIGLTVKSDVGQDCAWCDGFACPRIKWWDCYLADQDSSTTVPATAVTTPSSPVTSPVSSPSLESTPSTTPAASSGNSDTTTTNFG